MIKWFADNPIASKILMIMLLCGGLFASTKLNREVFPTAQVDQVNVSVYYRGAGPKEVEEQVTIRIEEAVADLDGIKRITSTSRNQGSTVSIEAETGYDIQRLLDDVKTRVDSITTFPAEIERPQVTQPVFRNEAIWVILYGDASERVLKDTAFRVKDQVSLLSEVARIDLEAFRDDQISIELSEESLRRYGLSFDSVTAAIRQSSINLPAGTIRSGLGDIQVQTRGQAYTGTDFENIVVRANNDGSTILLGDVATVVDGFSDTVFFTRYNGKPMIFMQIKMGDNPNITKTVAQVKEFVEENRHTMPDGVEIDFWNDQSEAFDARVDILASNAITGLMLVFAVLMLFLRPRLAMWVAVGIAIAIGGSLLFLGMTHVSLNMISLFAFLMILGIVVDDAIIVGESVYTTQQRGIAGKEGAILGAKTVSQPVMFAVTSTMLFFGTMLMLDGVQAQFAAHISIVVILVLTFSLIESLLILPSHLAHMPPETEPTGNGMGARFARTRKNIADSLVTFSKKTYGPFVENALQKNGTTVFFYSMVFIVVVALLPLQYVKVSFFPEVEQDFVMLQAEVPEGSAYSVVQETIGKIESSAIALQNDDSLKNLDGSPVVKDIVAWGFGQRINVFIGLERKEGFEMPTKAISEQWRAGIKDLPKLEKFELMTSFGGNSSDISLRLSAFNTDELAEVSELLQAELAKYSGVTNVRDDIASARNDLAISLSPYGENMGVNLTDVARQVRQGFYGEQAQRVPRGREDVRVMVRYPKEDRSSLDQFQEMRVRTSAGEVPFETVASADFVEGYGRIVRIDRKRSTRVTADITDGTAANTITQEILNKNLETWKRLYPGLEIGKSGGQQEQDEFVSQFTMMLFGAIFIVYAIMAIGFKSFSMPFLVFSAIPFGFVGAVIGHAIFGINITIFSFFGVLAVAGVVVNDNLVLLDRVNRLREEGYSALEAAKQAGIDRFRPILLTSLTTFAGLMPIMFESSTNAMFLKPMVVSLAFGVLAATTITLVMVPSLYVTSENMRRHFKRFGGWLLAKDVAEKA